MFWTFFEALGARLVQFTVGIVLARLLLPKEFGLIGMLVIFMALAQVFLDSGFGAALIQKQDATEKDVCSIFYFNIAVGIVVAGLLCLTAPWIAAFYHQPVLTPLMRVLSLTIVINSLGLIQTTLLRKSIDFKAITLSTLFSGVVSGAVGISLALLGFGVWSLVAQQLTSASVRTVVLWILNSWRPVMTFSFQSMKEMFGFGSRILASGLLNQLFDNIYLLVIGRVFSAADLGFFTRAKQFQELPAQSLAGMVAKVTFPVFSNIRSEPERLKRGLKKALSTLVLVNFPLMIGLAVVAKPLVLIVLTEKWMPSVPYLQLLCIAGLTYPLHMINLNVLQALGRSDLLLRLEIIKKILICINIAVMWRWGIPALIGGQVILSFISFYLNSYYNGVLIDYTIWEQIQDLTAYLVAAVAMGIVVLGVALVPFPAVWMTLVVQVLTGVVVYTAICRIFRFSAFTEVYQIVLGRFFRPNKMAS